MGTTRGGSPGAQGNDPSKTVIFPIVNNSAKIFTHGKDNRLNQMPPLNSSSGLPLATNLLKFTNVMAAVPQIFMTFLETSC